MNKVNDSPKRARKPCKCCIDSPRTVLIVDDSDDGRMLLSRRLTRAGFEVVEAISGEAGVIAAARLMPDVVIMDRSMPGISGLEAVRRMKANLKTRKIPAIALTAHAMRGDRELALKAGFDSYETKPVRMDSLLKEIETLITERSD